jgi:tRNA pseudouridine38-40 synthase
VTARAEPDEHGDQHRVRLTLHYDGGGFAGWQVQLADRTVQGELEAALARLLQAPVRVIGAGRTDAGVHATGQVASCTVPRRWPAAELRRALNAVLPDDIWVAAATEAGDRFHARYDAVARGYLYRIGATPLSRSPFLRRWCWPLAEPVAEDRLNEAARQFVGDHSFRAFAKAGQPARGDRCCVHAAEWSGWAAGVQFRVVANRFLHHMVRYMVGTMVDVARGRRPLEDVAGLLRGGTALRTSRPAPASGLYLTRVYYEGEQWSEEDASDEILS